MTVIATTVEHADYAPSPVVTPVIPQVSQDEVHAVEKEQVRVLAEGEIPRPDPTARGRYARLLYRITGWETFSDAARDYVSRLWAEDWDSPEDSPYDQL